MTTRLFHVSDVHFGVENPCAVAAVTRALREEAPAALVCTGDMTQRATHRQYAEAEQWLAEIDVPVWLDVGNHDMPYYNLVERFKTPFARFERLKAKVAVERFETEDLVLIGLNSTVPAQKRWPWSDGVITEAALAQTLRQLERYADDPRHKIICAHHPLLGPEGAANNPTIGGTDAFEALAAAGASAALSGHTHVPLDQQRESGGQEMRLIGVGTLSTRLRGAPPSYQVLSVTKGQPIAVELRQFDALV